MVAPAPAKARSARDHGSFGAAVEARSKEFKVRLGVSVSVMHTYVYLTLTNTIVWFSRILILMYVAY